MNQTLEVRRVSTVKFAGLRTVKVAPTKHLTFDVISRLMFGEQEQLGVHSEERIIKKKNPWSSSTFSQYAGQSTRTQENTQLVEPYERTYHWHKL